MGFDRSLYIDNESVFDSDRDPSPVLRTADAENEELPGRIDKTVSFG